MIFSQPIQTPSPAPASPMLLLRVGTARHRVAAGAGSAVAPCAAVTTVPLAPPWLLGLVLHEGEAMPLVDLAAALADAPAAARARMLVTRAAHFVVAYAVDDVDADDGRHEAQALDLAALGRTLLERSRARWQPA